ncbi:MAG: undecaprenyl-diphosphate phosphatase [Candidatus Izemoplasmatales bacterium]
MAIIELLKYIFLGIVQGVTEVLPISSSGHVALFQAILNIETDQGILFLILVNFGSFIAVTIHFRKLLKRLFKSWVGYTFHKDRSKDILRDVDYIIKIGLATIPTVVMGYFLERTVDSLYHRYFLFVVAIGLLVTSTFLYVVRYAPEEHVNQNLSFKDAFVIGMIQPLAMIPGLSRSGITTSTGLLRKLSMETSLTFSMMLYLPISLGVMIYQFYPYMLEPSSTIDIGFDTSDPSQYFYYIGAFVASFIATRLSLKYIFKWFRQGKLTVFAVYTLILGMIALFLAVIKAN